MPHYRRPKSDYNYLYGVTLDDLLTDAIHRRRYGRDRGTYPAEANRALLNLFGDQEWISWEDLKTAANVVRGPRGWSAEFALDFVGNLIGWAIHLNLVEDVSEVGFEPKYRLIEREQIFEVIAGKAVRVRGLPDDQQLAMNVRLSRLRRLRETLDRKRDAAVGETSAHLVDRLIASTPDTPIPPALMPFLGAFLSDLADGLVLRDARVLLTEAHEGWDKKVQVRWLQALTSAAVDAGAAARRAKAERARQSELAEDADAFADI